jgi:tetratricopeptide (TPR) repeat protein
VALARFHMERKLLELAVAEEQPLDLVGRHGAAAVEAILLARSLNPADPELVRWHANLELWLHFNANGGGQALDAYFETMDDLLRLDPLDVGAMRRMAVQLGAVGRQAEMDALLDRILELEPDDAMAWIMRGRYSALDGHTESALHAFVRAKEAIFNCRVKAHSNSPRTRRFYEKILQDADLSMVRRSIRNLRLSLEI